MCPDSPDFPDSVKTAQVWETMQCICVYKQISTRSHGLIYYTLNVHIYIRYWFKHPRRVTEEGDTQKPPADSAAFIASPIPLMLNRDNSSIQSRRGDEEAKHGDGDTKNLIRSSHSGVRVQYGSSISGNSSSESLQ